MATHGLRVSLGSAGLGQASDQDRGGWTGRVDLRGILPRGRRGRGRRVLGPAAAVTLELRHPHTGGDAVPRAGHACKARFVCARLCADVSSCPFPIFLNILNEQFYLFENAKKPDPLKKI